MNNTLWSDPIPVESEFQLNEGEEQTPGPLDDFWYQPIGSANASGIRVTPESAMRVAAVMACVRVLAETIASLPLFIYRQRPDGGKEKAADHPLYSLLHTRRGTPNAWQTAVEFREMMVAHLLLRGNAYAEILPGRLGAVSELVPIHPDRVTPEQLPNRRLRYIVRNPFGGEERKLTQDQVFHIRGISSDGISGLNPIQHASESIGLAVATEAHGSSFFRNGARPGTVLEHPGKPDQPTIDRTRAEWESMHRGVYKAHRTSILTGGMKAHELGMTNEDSQFLDTRKFQMIEICRIFRVPPHLIYDLERATFSNIEHQSIEFVQYGLVPWLTRWESAISRCLIADDEEYFAEHVVDGLLRGDIKSRYGAYAIARQWGWLNVDEIRNYENLNPLPNGEGQTYLEPMNMVPAGEERDGEGESDKNEEPPQTPPTRKSSQAALIHDAARRIANAEIREIEKRVKKASEDRPRFDAWLMQFYRDHLAYTERTLQPLVESYGKSNASFIALEIATDGSQILMLSDIAGSFEEWKESRSHHVAAQIERGLTA